MTNKYLGGDRIIDMYYFIVRDTRNKNDAECLHHKIFSNDIFEINLISELFLLYHIEQIAMIIGKYND